LSKPSLTAFLLPALVVGFLAHGTTNVKGLVRVDLFAGYESPTQALYLSYTVPSSV
jgi:hypothetical protein